MKTRAEKEEKEKKLELVIISKVQNRILGRIEIAINPEDDPNWKTGRREWAVKQEWPENLSPNNRISLELISLKLLFGIEIDK